MSQRVRVRVPSLATEENSIHARPNKQVFTRKKSTRGVREALTAPPHSRSRLKNLSDLTGTRQGGEENANALYGGLRRQVANNS